MIHRVRTNVFDAQTEEPLTYCPECGGEIYRYDPVAEVDGTLVRLHPSGRSGVLSRCSCHFLLWGGVLT